MKECRNVLSSKGPPRTGAPLSDTERRRRKVRFEHNVIRALEVSDEFAAKCRRGKVEEANSAALNMLGASSDDAVVGHPLAGFVGGDYAGMVEALLSLDVIEPQPVPLLLRRFDGGLREALLVVHPARELGEGVTVVTGRDIGHEKRLAKTAQSMDARFRLVVDGAMHLICLCRGAEVTYLNQAGRDLLRFRDAQPSTGWRIWQIFGAEYRDILDADMELLAEEDILPVRLHRFSEGAFDAQVRVTRLPSTGGVTEYMLEARDITALNRAVGTLRTMNETLERQVADRTRELRRQKGFVENLLTTLPNPVWWKDVDGTFRGYNPAFRDMHCLPGEEWLGRRLREVLPADAAARGEAGDEVALSGGKPAYEISMAARDGAVSHMLVNKSAWFDEASQPAGIIGTAVDITIQKQAEAELRRLATTDSLTGAFNRRFYMETAAEIFALSRRHGRQFSVMMLDIDHFKRVNDTYGHPAGDEVIRVMARTCMQFVRAEDTVGRLGGEEFAIVLPETPREGATALAERMREAIAALRVEADGHAIAFTASIGVAELAADDTAADAVLARADQALYEAKRSGRNRVVAF
jgi:diguanylate cyclase (GGDEF)-like protein/PAS domain S-box-containing protein